MDPSEILNARFHIGGEFIRIGPNLDYFGGEEAMSEIERDKLSLQEVKGYLKDHTEFMESMKFYFPLPRKELINGLVFLNDDICSGSDYADEIMEQSDDELDAVITADEPDVVITNVEPESLTLMFSFLMKLVWKPHPSQPASACDSEPQASGHVNNQMVIAANVDSGNQNSD
ncbi:hypothetical protein D1007_38295 [Hordeum vulgare]|nr:hypothetical protein D1007_38295 [Hordeum vulgare]